MSNETKCFYEFGPFRLDGRTCLLWNHDELITLEPKIARTLLVLVRAKGELVEKENLIKEVWEGVAVTEHSMTRNISILRKTLKELLQGQDCIETVPTLGYRFVLPVTECMDDEGGKQPDQQPKGPDLVTGVPGLENPSPGFQNTPFPARRIRGWSLVTLVAVVVVSSMLVVGTLYTTSTKHDKIVRGGSSNLPVRPIVAVLGFRNLSPGDESEWLSTAFTEWLTSELAIGEKFQVISGENIARMKRDLAIGSGTDDSSEKIALISKNLGADYLVDGSYAVTRQGQESQVRLDMRVRDASGREIISSFGNSGT